MKSTYDTLGLAAMFARSSPRSPGFALPQASPDLVSIPPPPPHRTASSGPDPRQHGRRPPALNTAVPYVPGATHLLTPSATPSSLSSPFAASNNNTAHVSPAGTTPGPASRGVSPVNHRLSGNFSNMTYNPSEWPSGRQGVESRARTDAYGEPLHTPPPPYTVPQERSSNSSSFSRQNSIFVTSDQDLNSTPVNQDAVSAANAGVPSRGSQATAVNSTSRQAYDLRRTTLNHAAVQDYRTAQSYQQNPPQLSTSRTSSGSLSFQVHRASQDNSLLPPPPRRTPPTLDLSDAGISNASLGLNTRRSTSAGPTPVAGSSTMRTTRTFSSTSQQQQQQQEWSSGMPLPGPPPGPPPPSTRSRSASAHAGGDTNGERDGRRHRPPRLSLRNSNLAPIPGTPANVSSSTQTRAMTFPLRIDTGSALVQRKATAETINNDRKDISNRGISQTGPSALARRSALRGPAARGPSALRERSRSASGRSEILEPPSTTLSNNPWASALEQNRSPQAEALPESFRSSSTATIHVVGRSHTPPETPGSHPQKPPTNSGYRAEPTKVLPTPPLSQKPLNSANSLKAPSLPHNLLDQEDGEFMSEAMERHTEFLMKEKKASDDLERLTLFMEYVQQESLVRKERYITAFRTDDFDVEAAKGMLFNGSKIRRASTRETNISTDLADSSGPNSGNSVVRGESGWWNNYKPALSPIASMDYDEMSSRGRAPSRWWESQTGSTTDTHDQKVHRTKRESKYMSLSKKLLQNMENEMEPLYEDVSWNQEQEYPNEKTNPKAFGFHDEGFNSPPLTQHPLAQHTPRPKLLDISRFVTLPPPYPRHYPAVNNNHPDLTDYRTTVRTLSDLSDAKNRRSRHQVSIEAMRADRRQKIDEMKRKFKAGIQEQIAEGSVSFGEAAEAEKMIRVEEHHLERQGLQAEFDTLQDVVINPLHGQLNDRIEKLGNSLQALQHDLFASAANQDPDQPVQEGDDVPELLEQLTQLKWLFEARENLHQELFDLLSQRNDAYKAIVALPYHQTNNTDKIRDTEAFFEKDAATRHATFCAEALKRHESFLQFVENNALRGIEMQSSAFWDITPGLVDLLQKIPTDPGAAQIDISDEELEENPTYREHPQQYLYLLLRHAEKSSYQYIEGQVNLYCLVHEVKTSSLAAHYRASKAQQKMAGDQNIDLADARLEDEGELTEELKNRAAMIEEQWQDALGQYFSGVSERIKQQLQERGAWDDIAAEVEG